MHLTAFPAQIPASNIIKKKKNKPPYGISKGGVLLGDQEFWDIPERGKTDTNGLKDKPWQCAPPTEWLYKPKKSFQSNSKGRGAPGSRAEKGLGWNISDTSWALQEE